MESAPETTRDNWLGTPHDRASASAQPLPLLAIATEAASAAYEHVLKSVGATIPSRDAADSRVLNDVRAGTGKIIDSQEEVGGWPELPAVASDIVDSDADGLPDEWERRHGLDPANPNDSAKPASSGAYTWLEVYLNELAQPAAAAR
jgi:hypothetical protein